MITVFLNVYNCFQTTQKLTSRLLDVGGCSVHLIDNKSTYPPLLKWYENLPSGVEVLRLGDNMGYTAPWKSGIIAEKASDRYVVSDPDLDLTDVPDDFFDVLNQGLDLYPDVKKCGLSLKIDDLPVSPLTQAVITHESQFWAKDLGTGYFEASTDTTFALYEKARFPVLYEDERRPDISPAVRTAPPYTARHMPWYVTPDMLMITPDMSKEEKALALETFYYLRSLKKMTHWGAYLLHHLGVAV